MENILPTNRPFRIDTVRVNKIQFEHIFTDSAAAMGEKIARDLARLKDDIAPACDKTFVMMKNKQVWFDCNNAALYPKFEVGVLQAFNTTNQPTRNYSLNFAGLNFVPMTSSEFDKSFRTGSGNPYLLSDGKFRYFPGNSKPNYRNAILTEEIDSSNQTHVRQSDGNNSWWKDGDVVTLVPIYRLRGRNASAMSYIDSLVNWIKLGLIPEGLTSAQEKFYSTFMTDYPKIDSYISGASGNIVFDSAKFTADVLAGRFIQKVFDYDFDIKGTLAGVLSGEKKFSGDVGALKRELLDCDHKRANIQPYEERQLTDVNRGHWELFEAPAKRLTA